MDRPLPQPHTPPPESTAGVTLSGLLPPASLIESLLHASADLAALHSLPFLQTRNTAAAIQRARLVSSLLEELHDSTNRGVGGGGGGGGGGSLPPSSILCLTELYAVIRRTKTLLDDLASRSALWALLNTEASAKRFLSSTRELAAALDILPLSLLPISPDIREQIELLHRQTKRAGAGAGAEAGAGGELCVDSREIHLRNELFCVMAKEKGFLDFNKVEEIMSRIGLRTAAAYQEEIKRLEAEILNQAGTGGLRAVSNINNLIAFVSYAKNVIFRCTKADAFPNTLTRSSSQPIVNNIPDEFRCPITLDLMKDPVVLASGHTYDRSSISRWINSGHQTCPKSGKKLIHMALIPNYNLKSLCEQWCEEHNLSSNPAPDAAAAAFTVDHISETRAAIEAVRMTAEFLVGKLAMGSPETQRQAAYELRLLAKSGMDNRRRIAEAGAIPFLVNLLRSRDPRTQENAVTALLNLSIFENNKTLIMAAGAIDSIVNVLRDGETMEARENAAATIFSLSISNECKMEIGKRGEAVTGLVELLQNGTPAGKKDAATALLNLAVYDPNRAAVVAAGAAPVLIDLLMDEKAGITDEALAVLALLCECREGMRAIGENRAVVAILLDLMRFGSEKGKENAIAVLMGLCKDGGAEMGKRLLMNASSVPSLQSLAATGSLRARRKANALLRLLNRCFSQSNSAPI